MGYRSSVGASPAGAIFLARTTKPRNLVLYGLWSHWSHECYPAALAPRASGATLCDKPGHHTVTIMLRVPFRAGAGRLNVRVSLHISPGDRKRPVLVYPSSRLASRVWLYLSMCQRALAARRAWVTQFPPARSSR